MKKLLFMTFFIINFQAIGMEKEINIDAALKKKFQKLYDQQKTNIIPGLAIYDLVKKCTDSEYSITNKKIKKFLYKEDLIDRKGNVHPLIKQYVLHYMPTDI